MKTKIKRDSHSRYIRTGGRIFRPVFALHSYENISTTDYDSASLFDIGAEVKAKHLFQTPFAELRANNLLEFWHSHGPYSSKKADECWKPA